MLQLVWMILFSVLCNQSQAAVLNMTDGGGGLPHPIMPKRLLAEGAASRVPTHVLADIEARASQASGRESTDIPCDSQPTLTHVALGDSVSFSTPNYPGNYPDSTSCGWKFETDPEYSLDLFCTEIRLLRNDYLVIDDPVSGYYYGYDNLNLGNAYYYFAGNTANLQFSSDRRRNTKGFYCYVYPYDATTTTTSPASTTTRTPPPLSECECGKSVSGNRIVGGSDADRFEYPWMVGLGDTHVYCGATLICRNWVVTAAHCISGGTITMRLNMYDTSDLSQTIKKTSKQVIVHEGYDSNTLVNDIALIRIDPVDWATDPVRPACLPEAPYDTYAGLNAIMTGWGTLRQNGQQPDILQEVSMPVLTNDDCKDAYPQYVIASSSICAGVPEGGLDTCQGDSGGPMLYNNGGNYEQIGITSWGIGCAKPGYPGVYTRVSSYVDWINSKTGGCDTCLRSSID